MKNIINFKIDFAKIPKSVKKYLYIHEDILLGKKINSITDKENMVEIFDNEIKIEPFWLDKPTLSGDKEMDYLTDLEGREMFEYIEKNGGKFGIFVRKTVKEKLLLLDKYFKEKGYFLALKIGYRPYEVQKKLFEKFYIYFKNKYKDLSEENIYNLTVEFISNPDKSVSPHITGGAVDVVLYDKNGFLVDMGVQVAYIGEKSNLTTNDITEEQRKNRDLLVDGFLEFGFSCLASEWWHFSYGDPYWAEFYGEEEALYGTVKFIKN